MRKIAVSSLLVGLLITLAASSGLAADDHHLRFRANDAPLAGRFTVDVFMLDTLDVTVSIPGPGRIVLLRFSDSSGGNTFIVPGDFYFQNDKKRRWNQGFLPLGDNRLGGLLREDDVRWALWWVPSDSSFAWNGPGELRLWYGEGRGTFFPMTEKDYAREIALFPWEALATAVIDPQRTTAALDSLPNPAVFDRAPVPKTRTTPSFPKLAKVYAYEGTVNMAALVSAQGVVEDAYIVSSDAQHVLNVAALVSMMEWTFIAGRKNDAPVSGETMIPMTFTRGSRD